MTRSTPGSGSEGVKTTLGIIYRNVKEVVTEPNDFFIFAPSSFRL